MKTLSLKKESYFSSMIHILVLEEHQKGNGVNTLKNNHMYLSETY